MRPTKVRILIDDGIDAILAGILVALTILLVIVAV
jgi:hypothetical protein